MVPESINAASMVAIGVDVGQVVDVSVLLLSAVFCLISTNNFTRVSRESWSNFT